ncbi:NrdR family transcriptional regulator [Methylorubrum extorquens]
MICPKCSADTRVVNSRPHAEDATVIVRRRNCTGCARRFDTFESTRNVVKLRRNSRDGKAQWVAETSADVLAEKNRLYGLRRDARAESADTGRPVADVMRAWGIEPTAGRRPLKKTPPPTPTPRANEGSATTPKLETTR